MDTKSKILFWTLGVLVVLSVSASYYRFMVLHDYLVQAEVDCDPSYESCFVWKCNVEEDEECTGDPEEDTWYYKIAYRNAKNIPSCSAEDEECDQFTCPEGGEEECSEVLCSPETLEEYHVETACTIPADFAEEFYEDEVEDDLSESAEDEIVTEDGEEIQEEVVNE